MLTACSDNCLQHMCTDRDVFCFRRRSRVLATYVAAGSPVLLVISAMSQSSPRPFDSMAAWGVTLQHIWHLHEQNIWHWHVHACKPQVPDLLPAAGTQNTRFPQNPWQLWKLGLRSYGTGNSRACYTSLSMHTQIMP